MNRKKSILALLAMLALAGSTEAQIFNTSSDGNNTRSQTKLFEQNGFGNTTTGNLENLNNNEINTPIGSGLLLMAGMAGAYAMMRRRKDESGK